MEFGIFFINFFKWVKKRILILNHSRTGLIINDFCIFKTFTLLLRFLSKITPKHQETRDG